MQTKSLNYTEQDRFYFLSKRVLEIVISLIMILKLFVI